MSCPPPPPPHPLPTHIQWKQKDILFGLAGADSLNGGKGSDVLVGGKGRDTIEGCLDQSKKGDQALDISPKDKFIAAKSC